jgi:hypothetical protein
MERLHRSSGPCTATCEAAGPNARLWKRSESRSAACACPGAPFALPHVQQRHLQCHESRSGKCGMWPLARWVHWCEEHPLVHRERSVRGHFTSARALHARCARACAAVKRPRSRAESAGTWSSGEGVEKWRGGLAGRVVKSVCVCAESALAPSGGDADSRLVSAAVSKAMCMISRAARHAEGADCRLLPRMLLLHTSPDVTWQYVACMNAAFAAKRVGVTIDGVALTGQVSTYIQLVRTLPLLLLLHTHHCCCCYSATTAAFPGAVVRACCCCDSSLARSLPCVRSSTVRNGSDRNTSRLPHGKKSPQRDSGDSVRVALTQAAGACAERLPIVQACDLTKGAYVCLNGTEALLEHLLACFSANIATRELIDLPKARGLTFRGTCFCHVKAIDSGFVCSVCLSVFCAPHERCMTCGTEFTKKAAP